MQKAVSNSLLIFFLLILSCPTIFGQSISEKKSLISILKHLEEKHDIRFSYATNDIDDILIVTPNEHFNLEESLNYLSNKTSFNYIKINERYITVQNKKKTGLKCGKILDSNTGLALEGTEITFSNSSETTFTNKEGVFYAPSNQYSGLIIIKFLGYQDIIINSKEY